MVRVVLGRRIDVVHGRHDRVRVDHCGHRVVRVGLGHRIDVVHGRHGHVRVDHCGHRVVRVGLGHHDRGNQNHHDCGYFYVGRHGLGLDGFDHDALPDLASRGVDARQVRFQSRVHHPQ